jgi:Bacterial Ig-like domain
MRCAISWRLVVATGALALSATPALAVINDPPAGGVSIVTGVNTSFVAVEGLPPVPHTIEVWRAGVKIATSASILPSVGPVPPPGTIEINHPLEPDCWQGVTPDIRPGDQIRAMTAADTGNQSVAQDVQVGLPIRTGPTQVQLHGIAATPAGAPFPIAELGGIVRNTAVTAGGNGGGIKWLVPGPQASIAYDVVGNPTGTKFTITINFDGTMGIGSAQAEADAAMAGDVIEAEWASAGLNEISFADANGASGPNGDPCTQAAQPLQQGPTNVRLTAATDSGTSSTDGITNNTTPAITGTVSIPPVLAQSKVVNVYLDGAPVGGPPTASATLTALDGGVFTIALPTLTAATHSVVVSEVDTLLGPIGPIETTSRTPYTFIVDTSVPPAPTVTDTVPAGPANNNNPFVRGNSPETGSTVTLYTDGGCTTPTGVTGSAATFGATGLQAAVANDSTTTFFAAANDLAGNGPSGCSATGVTYVEDSTPPGTPVITSAPPVASNQATANFVFTTPAPAPVTVECRLTPVVATFGPCTTPLTFDRAGLADGTYTFTVRVSDPAGNQATADHTFSIDATAPAAPTFTATVPASPANDNSPEIRGLAEPLSTVRLYTDATCTTAALVGGNPVVGTAAAFATPGVTADVAGNTTTTFRATATDAAGNVSVCSPTSIVYVEDSTAPAAPNITAGPPALTNNATPSFAFTGEGGATFTCSLATGAEPTPTTCTSPRAYPGTADGSYTFRVRATDAAGNTSTAATTTFTLDATAPVPPTFTATVPASPSNVNTPVVRGAAEVGSTVNLYATVGCTGAPLASGTAATFGSTGITITVAANTTTDVRGTATDTAGNVSVCSPTPIGYVEDSLAPTTSILSGPPALTNVASPSFTFSSEAGATFECRLDPAGTFVPCVSGVVFGPLPDGPYTFRAKATDLAGNVGLESTRAFTVDATAPESPTFTGTTPPSPSNVDTPVIRGSAEPGSTVTLYLTASCTQVNPSFGSGSAATFANPGIAVTVLNDSITTIHATTTDLAGNTSACSPTSIAYTEDSTPPAAPTITSPAGAIVTNDTTPTFVFTLEPGVTYQCSVLGAFAPCTSPFTPTVAVEGSHTFAVQAIDAAGNASLSATRSVTIDTTAPAGPTLVTPPPLVGNDTTPTFTFTGEVGATFGCSMTGGAPFTPCVSPLTSAVLAAGDYTFAVRQTDQAGNVGATTTRTYSLDLTPPSAPTFTPPGPVSPANDNAPLIRGVAEAGSQVRLYSNVACTALIGGPGAAATFAATGVAAAVGDNSITDIYATATDVAGNISPCSAKLFTFEEDSTPPGAASILTGPPTFGTSRDVAFTFTHAALIPGESVDCSLSTAADQFGPCDSATPFARTGLVDGTYTFKVLIQDAIGNPATTSRTFTIDNIAPSVTIVSGPAASSTDTTPTFNFTASETGVTFACGTAQSGTPTFAPCAPPFTTGPFGLGDWIFSVRATDQTGNVGVAATSGFTIVAPVVPPVIGAPSVSTRKAVVRAGKVTLQVRCTGPANATCSGTVDIMRTIPKTATKPAKVVRIGRKSVTLLAGQTIRVTVTLTAAGRTALAKATGKRLNVRAVVTPTGATKPSSFPLTLTLPPAAK